MEDQGGRSGWRIRMEDQDGGSGWRIRVKDQDGGSGRRIRVEGQVGGAPECLWRPGIAGQDGGAAGHGHGAELRA